MTDPVVDAIIRLEHWMTGGADFRLKEDVRLLIDTMREAESLALEVEQLERQCGGLRADVDTMLAVLHLVSVRG